MTSDGTTDALTLQASIATETENAKTFQIAEFGAQKLSGQQIATDSPPPYTHYSEGLETLKSVWKPFRVSLKSDWEILKLFLNFQKYLRFSQGGQKLSSPKIF